MFLKRFFSFRYCYCHKVLGYLLKLLTSQNKIKPFDAICSIILHPKPKKRWQEMWWTRWQVVVVMKMKRSNGLGKYLEYISHGRRKSIAKLASHRLHFTFPSCKVFWQNCVFSHGKNGSNFLVKKNYAKWHHQIFACFTST